MASPSSPSDLFQTSTVARANAAFLAEPVRGTLRLMVPLPRPAKDPALRHYQQRTFNDLVRGIRRRRGAIFTVLMPRQAGKNQVSATLVTALLWRFGEPGGSIIYAAPTFTPQGQISFERTRAILEASAAVTALGVRVETFSLAAGAARAVYLSASPLAHVAGHTASIALIVDEAQDIERDWFERQFRPMCASTGAPTILLGTPWNGANLLDETVALNRARDVRLRAWHQRHGDPRRRPIFLHHQASWKQVEASNPDFGRHVRGELLRLGGASPYFRTQYGLQTVDAAGRLFSEAQIRSLQGSHPRLAEPVFGERYVAGLDVAGDGERADASVLTIGRVTAGGRCEVVQQLSWRGVPINVLEAAAAEAAQAWRLERLVIDGTGMGAAIATHIDRQLPGMEVERFIFGERSKSELGYQLTGAASRGTLAIYADDGSVEAQQCAVELRACERRLVSGRRMSWGDARGHDDYVVSLAICLRAAEQCGVPRFATGRRRD